jgi:hypothetical protein
LYLLLTPRLGWVSPPVAILLFLAADAVARRRRWWVAVVMLVPYVCVCAFVAYLVVSQRAG